MGELVKTRRKNSLRLKDWDYTKEGYYFVTICVKGRIEWFGEIKDGIVLLNENGEIVNQCWNDLPEHYANCTSDKFVIMPNHVHGIIIINNVGEGLKPSPTIKCSISKRHSLTEIIRGFKTFSSRKINEQNNERTVFRWQRSFHDHIIRNEIDLNRVRHYIINNPDQWDNDENNLSRR